LNRREFLKTATVAGAGALFLPGPSVVRAAGDSAHVAVVKGGPPGKLVRKAVDALGGIGAFVKRGESVVVKPNIGWDRTPEQGANTHPLVVWEIVQMCLESGAAKVRVFDRTCNDARRCYVTSGIAQALEKIRDPRLEVSHVDERRFRDVEIPGGVKIQRWSFYEEALEADKFINLPIAKHHSAAGLTIGMKNIMGIAGKNRAVLHRAIHEILPDLNRAVRSHLTLVDATRILVANGPQGGRLEDVRTLDTVLAGTDVVAVDSVACTLFDRSPREIRYLQLAHEQGLGVGDLDRIRTTRLTV
jgi:uncharacterized protein (DUF362 family)